jgi:hypothetical protein
MHFKREVKPYLSLKAIMSSVPLTTSNPPSFDTPQNGHPCLYPPGSSNAFVWRSSRRSERCRLNPEGSDRQDKKFGISYVQVQRRGMLYQYTAAKTICRTSPPKMGGWQQQNRVRHYVMLSLLRCRVFSANIMASVVFKRSFLAGTA